VIAALPQARGSERVVSRRYRVAHALVQVEQRQLGAGVRAFVPHEDTSAIGVAARAGRAGQLGDFGPSRREPSRSGQGAKDRQVVLGWHCGLVRRGGVRRRRRVGYRASAGRVRGAGMPSRPGAVGPDEAGGLSEIGQEAGSGCRHR
jgi:hypothetical protein